MGKNNVIERFTTEIKVLPLTNCVLTSRLIHNVDL